MKKIPHQQIIDTSRKLSDAAQYLLVISSCIISAEILYKVFVALPDKTILSIFSFLIFVGFSFYLFINTCSNIFFFKFSIELRNDLIDNSFGSNFLAKKSIGYFSNDNIPQGIYKFAVNVFENVFFTHDTSKNMKRNQGVFTGLIILVLIISAVLGIKEIWLLSIKIPVIAILIIEFFRLWYFVTRAHRVYESFRHFFDGLSRRVVLSEKENASALKHILDYETLITWWGFHLSSKIFKVSNLKLSQDWVEIKTNLGIPVT
jgi:hypothetical protein